MSKIRTNGFILFSINDFKNCFQKEKEFDDL